MHRPLVAFIALFSTIAAFGQTQEPATAKALAAHDRGSDRAFEEVIKSSDDVLWYFEIGDVATIDKVYSPRARRIRPARARAIP